MAVGAPFDGTAAWKAGAVYLFRRSTAELIEGKPLVSPEPQVRELFGAAVAMSPELIVVGAPSDDRRSSLVAPTCSTASRAPCAHPSRIRSRSGAGDRFGAAVAIIDGRVLVGAPLTEQPAARQSRCCPIRAPPTCSMPRTDLRSRLPESRDGRVRPLRHVARRGVRPAR